MKKVLVILVILGLVGVLVWALLPTATTTTTTTTNTAITEDLETQLRQTEDDGGVADFVELQKSAEGL